MAAFKEPVFDFEGLRDNLLRALGSKATTSGLVSVSSALVNLAILVISIHDVDHPLHGAPLLPCDEVSATVVSLVSCLGSPVGFPFGDPLPTVRKLLGISVKLLQTQDPGLLDLLVSSEVVTPHLAVQMVHSGFVTESGTPVPPGFSSRVLSQRLYAQTKNGNGFNYHGQKVNPPGSSSQHGFRGFYASVRKVSSPDIFEHLPDLQVDLDWKGFYEALSELPPAVRSDQWFIPSVKFPSVPPDIQGVPPYLDVPVRISKFLVSPSNFTREQELLSPRLLFPFEPGENLCGSSGLEVSHPPVPLPVEEKLLVFDHSIFRPFPLSPHLWK